MSQGFRNSKGESVVGFVVYTKDGHNVALYDDYIYERKDGCIIPLPKGSESDGLSYPSITWNITPPFGTGWMAGFVHDICYRNGIFKDYADETLLEILEFLGCSYIDCKITYEGVHRCGQSSYDEDVALWKKKYGY